MDLDHGVPPVNAAGPFVPPRPRRVRLDFARPCPPDWMAGDFTSSCLMNTYSLVFPALETIMVRHISRVARSTEVAYDEAAIRAFLVQEGSHAHEHRRSLGCVRAQGYDIGAIQRRIDWIVLVALDAMLCRILCPLFGDAFAVAIFAAAEHWTTSMSEMALTPRAVRVPVGRLDRDEVPEDLSDMEILFLWHVAEEIEHKTVVADFLRAVRDDEPTRIGAFLLATPVFLLLTTVGFLSMLRQAPRVLGRAEWRRHGRWRRIAREARAGLVDFPRTCWTACRIYLRRGFHPSMHDTDELVTRAFNRLHALRSPHVARPSPRTASTRSTPG